MNQYLTELQERGRKLSCRALLARARSAQLRFHLQQTRAFAKMRRDPNRYNLSTLSAFSALNDERE